MRLGFARTSLGIAVTFFTVAMTLGQGGQGQPGGQGGAAPANAQGATILNRACGSCHGADAITNYHFESADGYKDIINSMIAAGAQVTPQETPVLADYLFATYGKKPAAEAAPAAAAGADPGKAILESACTVCHGLDGLANHVYDTKEPYEGLVRNMIGYGATVTDAQIPALVDYMFKAYGKKPAAGAAAPAAAASASGGADPGKAILESACTVCHGLDGLANHNYTSKEPYESLVKSMVAYGATVKDEQMGPLVDYMFKTYGKK
jgi:cytochrome c5